MLVPFSNLDDLLTIISTARHLTVLSQPYSCNKCRVLDADSSMVASNADTTWRLYAGNGPRGDRHFTVWATDGHVLCIDIVSIVIQLPPSEWERSLSIGSLILPYHARTFPGHSLRPEVPCYTILNLYQPIAVIHELTKWSLEHQPLPFLSGLFKVAFIYQCWLGKLVNEGNELIWKDKGDRGFKTPAAKWAFLCAQ